MSLQRKEAIVHSWRSVLGILLRAAVSVLAIGATVGMQIDAEAQSAIRPRVINGDDAPQGAWPWMVAVLSANVTDSTEAHFCGGALIGPQHILTAAHCVNGSNPADIQLLIGERTLPFGNGDRHDILGYVVHPKYNPITIEHDLAIIKLAKPVNATPIALALQSDAALYQAETEATVIGWGMTNPTLPILPSVLQQAAIPIKSDLTCMQEIGRWYKPQSMMCAGTPASSDTAGDGVDACFGDSGGPLMVPDTAGGWKLVGVVSWGLGCANSKTRGVYAEVPAHEDFVTSYPPAPPYALKGPTISGNPREGEILTCTPGEYSGDAPTSIDYSWHRWRDGKDENNETLAVTLPTYTLTAQDVGTYIWCEVNASNSGGSSGYWGTEWLWVEAAEPPPPVEPTPGTEPTPTATPIVTPDATASPDPTPTPQPTAPALQDTVAPKASIAQFDCHRRSCDLLITTEDDSSGVKEVSATLELTYQGRCARGRRCTRVKVKSLSTKSILKDVWTTSFKGYSKPKQRAKVTVSVQDEAGNRTSVAAVATKRLTR